MKATIKHLPDLTIELTMVIPWPAISDMYDKVVDDTVKNTELSGFRKGKAPRNVVEKNLDKSKVYEEVIRRVVPQIYEDAVKEHKLKPIILPKIELKEASEKKDWTVIALTAEKPKLAIGSYKEKIKELKSNKSKKIWLPGEKPEKEDKNTNNKPTLDEILKALYDSINATVSPLLIEHEVNRMLSDLIDQTKKLGMTVEQYLSAKGKTVETIRSEYASQAARTLILEFALEEIANSEGIIINDDDIDTVIKTAKTDEEKKSLEKERYYIASVLRRQKTLDFLASI